jgi:hypothetical protein
MNFVVYDKYTGEIKRTGFCGERDFYKQAIEQNEFVLEGVADGSFDKVDIKNKRIIIEGKKSKKEYKTQDDMIKKDNNMNILILDKMNEILRRMAIKELKEDGKLPKDYRDKGANNGSI